MSRQYHRIGKYIRCIVCGNATRAGLAFDAKNLTALVERHGFARVASFELPSLRATGLMARLRFVGEVGKVALYTQFAAIKCAIPVLRLFPSDIVVCAYRKV